MQKTAKTTKSIFLKQWLRKDNFLLKHISRRKRDWSIFSRITISLEPSLIVHGNNDSRTTPVFNSKLAQVFLFPALDVFLIFPFRLKDSKKFVTFFTKWYFFLVLTDAFNTTVTTVVRVLNVPEAPLKNCRLFWVLERSTS